MAPAGAVGDGPGASRAATERLLDGLRRGGWTPTAWVRFAAATGLRSFEQVRTHPYAFVEVSAVHVLFALAAPRRGRLWVMTSWAMAITHLGLLEDRRTLGWANLITLARANLPAVGDRCGPWVPLLAAVSDVADGAIARATDTTTPFGRHADFLADTAWWSWYALRHEPNPALKMITVAAWVVPVVAVTGVSVARGGMIDVPRYRWWRPLAALQAVVCVRADRAVSDHRREALPRRRPGLTAPHRQGVRRRQLRLAASGRPGPARPGQRPERAARSRSDASVGGQGRRRLPGHPAQRGVGQASHRRTASGPGVPTPRSSTTCRSSGPPTT